MNHYQRAFRDVLEYMDSHLDQKLDLNTLSGVAHLSRFHFERLFSAHFGIGVEACLRHKRLYRAACQLAYRTQMSIMDIARNNGFTSSEAFARVFSRYIGLSPAQFRQSPDWSSAPVAGDPDITFRQPGDVSPHQLKVELTVFSRTEVAVMRHRWSPQVLGSTIRKFIDWRRQQALTSERSRTFNLIYDDPHTTAPSDYRFDLCAELTADVSLAEGMHRAVIPAGRCARVRHTGPEEELENILLYLYGDWLAESGEQLRDYPVILERIILAGQQPVCDIYLPLE